MAKPQRQEVGFHYARQTGDAGERRRAIRQGYYDYQWFGWKKDPPYAMGDPLRWHWQDGAEMAEKVRQTGHGSLEATPGWT